MLNSGVPEFEFVAGLGSRRFKVCAMLNRVSVTVVLGIRLRSRKSVNRMGYISGIRA